MNPVPLDGTNNGWKAGWKTIRHHRKPSTTATTATTVQTIASPNRYNVLDTGDFTTPWKIDSAASDHYAGKQAGVWDRRPVTNGIDVSVANGASMHQIETGTVPFNKLPPTATSAAIFEHMLHPLLGCGRLVKDGCKIIPDDLHATIINKSTRNTVLTADFDHASSTWNVLPQQRIRDTPLPHPPPHTNQRVSISNAYNAYCLKTNRDLVSFYGGAVGWPVKQTWIAAITNGSYASWPGLTAPLARQYYQQQVPTVMGHMHARRSGIRSTKPSLPLDLALNDEDLKLHPPRPGALASKQRRVGAHLVEAATLTGAIATDFCGRYPHTSSCGMKYIFVLYDYDSNAILATPTKSCAELDMVAAYDECYGQLRNAGITPVLQYLDNEVSATLIASIKAKDLNYQLASPTITASTQQNVPFKPSKTTSSPSLPGVTIDSRNTFGVVSSSKQSKH